MCKDAPNTGVGDRLARLETWFDVDVTSAIVAGLDDTVALSGWVAQAWSHPYLVLDGSAGASRALIKDDKGVQLAVHGVPIEVCGNQIGVLPTPHDQTSIVRLYGATARAGIPVVSPRVVTKKATATGETALTAYGLCVHYRNREPNELFAVHVYPNASGNLWIDELQFSPWPGKAPQVKNLYNAAVAGGASLVVCPQLGRGDGVVQIRCDQLASFRVFGAGAP